MYEVTIKYKKTKTLNLLQEIGRYLDFTVEEKPKQITKKKSKLIPITYAEKPDIMALSGIWKDKEIKLEELREKAWGNRL